MTESDTMDWVKAIQEEILKIKMRLNAMENRMCIERKDLQNFFYMLSRVIKLDAEKQEKLDFLFDSFFTKGENND